MVIVTIIGIIGIITIVGAARAPAHARPRIKGSNCRGSSAALASAAAAAINKNFQSPADFLD